LRVLILYTELAGYLLACVKHYLLAHKNAEILLIHYPINSEAPFLFSSIKNLETIEFKERSTNEISTRITDFKPQIILCSGWGNKYYLSVVKKYFNLAETVVCFDNQWFGNIKQHLLKLISPFWLKKLFKKVWVPGKPQKAYALQLGFRTNQIFTGFYVADNTIFEPIGEKRILNQGIYPKVMLSVARYIAQKDLPTLWQAFIKANSNTGNHWQLNCLGLGELYEQRIQNSYIQHLGFKQPQEMETIMANSGIYVLPSLYEPWGVAVHECALAALPLVLSDKIGAGSMFLNTSNGFTFKAGDALHLQAVLEQIMRMTDEALWKMAEASYKEGKKLSLHHWSNTLNNMVE
jgi:glycosyltransferase involved in cell wall biosynthesis